MYSPVSLKFRPDSEGLPPPYVAADGPVQLIDEDALVQGLDVGSVCCGERRRKSRHGGCVAVSSAPVPLCPPCNERLHPD